MKDDLSLYISNIIDNNINFSEYLYVTSTTTCASEYDSYDYYSKLSVEEIKYMLNKIDIKIIEQFLRDKKLEKINLDGSK